MWAKQAEMPSDAWQALPFAQCVYFQEGPGIRKNQHSDQGIPFINIRCIQNARLIPAKMNYVNAGIAQNLYKHFLLEAGDVVVSGSGTLGKVAQVNIKELPCLTNTGIIRMRTQDAKQLHQLYLLYFLQSRLFQEQVRGLAIGSVQKNFGPVHLKQMKIYLPPLKLQEEMASLLMHVDELIDNIYATSVYLHQLNQALFDNCFINATGAERLLKEFCSLALGGDWGRDRDTEENDLVAAHCLRGVDLMHLCQEGYAEAPLRWIKPASLKKRKLTEYDILIAASGAGACGQALWADDTITTLYDQPVVYSNFCKRLRAVSPEAALYISYVLQSMHQTGEMQHYISGTSVPNLDIHGLLNGKKIIMPNKKQLTLFTELVEQHNKLHYSRQLTQLQSLKQHLLNELFTG